MGKESADLLFKTADFRIYVQNWVSGRPRGEYRRISEALTMHTTLVSQVFNGKKCLTEEQAANLCSHMGLNSLERDYFLKLVQIERAGSSHLKEIYVGHLKQLRKRAQEIKNIVPESKELSEQDQAIFYSSWQYSLIRLLTDLKDFRTAQEISNHLGLSLSRVQEILSFLVSRGLCTHRNGLYTRTNQNTHIEAQSPLSIRHHLNWRTKALAMLETSSGDDLSFTAPVTISKKDVVKVRQILLEAIAEISKVVEDSPSEETIYLGIDWLKIKSNRSAGSSQDR
jgi:uncharacterized protein (TIGR02147 family)